MAAQGKLREESAFAEGPDQKQILRSAQDDSRLFYGQRPLQNQKPQ